MTAPSASRGGRPPRSPGRAFLLFTTLRLLLFFAVLVPVRLLVDDPLLAFGVALVLSAVLGIPLLRRYREDLNSAVAARRRPHEDR